MIKNNKLYDQLKFLAQILLPALGTLYLTLAGIWGLPSAKEVVGTIVAVDTFLGVLLQLSSNAYANSGARYTGTVHVEGEQDEGDVANVRISGLTHAQQLVGKDEIVLKVRHEDKKS